MIFQIIPLFEEGSYIKRVWRVFRADSSGIEMKLKNKFELLRANQSGREGYWLAKMLLSFRVEAKHNAVKSKEELTSVQYIECTEKMDKIDNVLGAFV